MNIKDHIEAGHYEKVSDHVCVVPTRAGEKAFIYTTRHHPEWEIVGGIDGESEPFAWQANGRITRGDKHEDPRDLMPPPPRKSAMDLFKAGVVSLTDLASLGAKEWDYEDSRRVVIQRSGITRVRPAMRKGWKATVELMITTPEYISPEFLQGVITKAGLLVGVGDFRPTYGRFGITNFEILKD